MKYLLFVFAKHEIDQDNFVKLLAGDISHVSDSTGVNFYYGPESVIFSFSSDENIQNLKEFFNMLLGVCDITYFMIPFEPDKMSYYLRPEVQEELLNGEKNDIKTSLDSDLVAEVQSLLFGEDDFDEKIIKPKKKVVSLDEILDKMIDVGYDCLTSKEKNLLDKYSKQ